MPVSFCILLNHKKGLIAGVIDKYVSGVVDTAEHFVAGVIDTPDKHSFEIISVNFRKKVKTILMGYSGAWGTLIYERKKTEVGNLVSNSL